MLSPAFIGFQGSERTAPGMFTHFIFNVFLSTKLAHGDNGCSKGSLTLFANLRECRPAGNYFFPGVTTLWHSERKNFYHSRFLIVIMDMESIHYLCRDVLLCDFFHFIVDKKTEVCTFIGCTFFFCGEFTRMAG